eukprot:GHVT01096561.1.p1 GENE.GHVT01096561.1~~GHVT01096561.1.p1  ORF type:complete len:116 (+),score=5.80 GHVT01096561.1:265-612(+)
MSSSICANVAGSCLTCGLELVHTCLAAVCRRNRLVENLSLFSISIPRNLSLFFILIPRNLSLFPISILRSPLGRSVRREEGAPREEDRSGRGVGVTREGLDGESLKNQREPIGLF